MNRYIEKFFIIEGIILFCLGLLFFISPVESFLSFTTIIGALMIISAIIRMIRAFTSHEKLYYILTALVDFLFGLIVCFSPIMIVESLILLYGLWMLVKGIYTIILSLKSHQFGFNYYTLLSILSTLIGAVVFFCPLSIMIISSFIPYLIGSYFIMIAICEIFVGYNLKETN